MDGGSADLDGLFEKGLGRMAAGQSLSAVLDLGCILNRRRFAETPRHGRGASLTVPGLVDASPRRQAHVSAGRIGFKLVFVCPRRGRER